MATRRRKYELQNISVYDGDTPEWVKLQFTYEPNLIIWLKAIVEPGARTYDPIRRCWFLHKDIADRTIQALKTWLDTQKIVYKYEDRRTVLEQPTVEDYESFFHSAPATEKLPTTKEQLIKSMEHLLKNNGISASIRQDIDFGTAKKLYRQAALQFHPDRNAGDGSKMAELNVIWTQLQERF